MIVRLTNRSNSRGTFIGHDYNIATLQLISVREYILARTGTLS